MGGDRGGLESFAVFEFEMTEDPGDAARVYLHDHGTDVFWPMKDGRCRWNFHVDSVGEDRVPSLEELHRLLKTRAPGFPLPEKLYWSSFVMFDRRVAESYGRGRIRLAGDAAHLTGPVGAQSMNVGLDEACDLAERLAGIIRDDAPSELLDTYGEARRADWLDILGETGAPKPGAECSEWVASRAGGILPCVPASGADLDALLGQLGLAAVRTQAGV